MTSAMATTVRRWVILGAISVLTAAALTIVRHLFIGNWGDDWLAWVAGIPCWYISRRVWRGLFGTDWPDTGQTR